MLNIRQFREELLRPSLDEIQHYSEAAEELLVMTCAAETLGGTFIQQVGGPALGIYQMEPLTYEDIWSKYLSNNTSIVYMMLNKLNMPLKPSPVVMKFNLKYATYMARIYYLRFKEPLPAHDDVMGLATYYYKYWATPLSKASKEDAIKKYHLFAGKPKRK
jgi:hypothetical protein